MSGKAVGWAFEQRELTPTEKLVLLGFADNADQRGKCWPSKDTIIEKTGLSRATVFRAFGALVEKGLLGEAADDKGRPFYLLALSHGETAESHSETGKSQAETPYIEEPSLNLQGTNGSPPQQGFEEWLKHYHEVTGNTAVRGSKPARDLFKQRRRDWTTEDLKVATIGCNADHWRRQNGHVVPETILRASNVEKYRLAGLKAIAESKHERGEDEASAERRRSMEAQGLVEDFDL